MLNQYMLAITSYYSLSNATQIAQQVMSNSTIVASLWPLFIEAK
jgi:hypothetical protein